jgi:hypothetical protein
MVAPHSSSRSRTRRLERDEDHTVAGRLLVDELGRDVASVKDPLAAPEDDGDATIRICDCPFTREPIAPSTSAKPTYFGELCIRSLNSRPEYDYVADGACACPLVRSETSFVRAAFADEQAQLVVRLQGIIVGRLGYVATVTAELRQLHWLRSHRRASQRHCRCRETPRRAASSERAHQGLGTHAGRDLVASDPPDAWSSPLRLNPEPEPTTDPPRDLSRRRQPTPSTNELPTSITLVCRGARESELNCAAAWSSRPVGP